VIEFYASFCHGEPKPDDATSSLMGCFWGFSSLTELMSNARSWPEIPFQLASFLMALNVGYEHRCGPCGRQPHLKIYLPANFRIESTKAGNYNCVFCKSRNSMNRKHNSS
jgi:hypothetical protein